MTNIEKEIITYKILTRGTKAELGAHAQDLKSWVEANAAEHSTSAYPGFLMGMVQRVLARLNINKSGGPLGPQSPSTFSIFVRRGAVL
jgi:hypothetical protein